MQPNSSTALKPDRCEGDSSNPVSVPPAEAVLSALVDQELCFPDGLFGFHQDRRFCLRRFDPGDDSPSPFFILESLDRELSFPVIHPESIAIDYRLPAGAELLAAVEAKNASDMVVLLIATVRDRIEEITLNLQGPLVINPATRLGAQWVVEDYPLRHPLLKRPRP
jgi:flagellar assembly factor FliW